MPQKRLHEWQTDLMVATSVDALKTLIRQDKVEVEKVLQKIATIAQGIFVAIGRAVSVLKVGDRGMFEIMEPPFADRNRMSYEMRAVFLRSVSPDQTALVDDATNKALSFCDYLDNQSEEGKSYLEIQRMSYGQALRPEIDVDLYHLAAGAASLYEMAQLAQSRIDSLRTIMPSALFDAFMQLPLSTHFDQPDTTNDA